MSPEIGYVLAAEHWGKGYATEAVTGLVKHLFETESRGMEQHEEVRIKRKELHAYAAINNVGSQRVLLKNGFHPLDGIVIKRNVERIHFLMQRPVEKDKEAGVVVP